METALVRVTNDLLMSADAGSPSILILLDLTAAFDTVDHHILLHRLHSSIGLSDTTLAWFTSYLMERTEYVSLGDAKSSPVVSLKDQSLAPPSSRYTCSPLVVSSAGMEYLSTATLMTPNSTSKQTQPPLQLYPHFPSAWRR
jgi:hypothetical protein